MHDELLDAGCTPECQAEYETLHQQQEKLSCLDYIIFTLEQHSKGREIV